MKYILTSNDYNLRKIFNSEDFDNNFDMVKNEFTKEYERVLKLPNETPVVGDNLYFINNYYEQIPVKVVGLSYGNGRCMVFCEKTELYNIDPFIYSSFNGFCGKYTNEFVSEICKAYNHIITCRKCVDVNCLNKISYEVYNYLNVNTCIDFMNVIYAIEEILSAKYPSRYKWHRPYKYEYADM